jgi:small-conductance mechanosensitive channel
LLRAALAAAFGLLAALSAAAADPVDDRDRALADSERELASIRRDLAAGEAADVGAVERMLREAITDQRSSLAPIAVDLRDVERDLEQLGPAPAENALAEAAPIAERRKALGASLARLQGQRTRALGQIDDASAMLAELSRRRLALLYRSLAERGPPLFAPRLWRDSSAGAAEVAQAAAAYIDGWLERRESHSLGAYASLALIGAAIVVMLLMIGPAHRWMRRNFSRRIEGLEPTRPRRVAVAGLKMLARLIPGVVGGAGILAAAAATGLLAEEGWSTAQAIWFAIAAVLLVEGFFSGLFSPSAPGWRLAPVDVANARAAGALLLAIVGVFGAKSVLTAIAAAAGAPPATTTALAGASAVAIGLILIALCRRGLWTRAAKGEREEAAHWPLVRRAGRVTGGAIALAALAGYVPLADFAASRLYFLAIILAVAWFLRAALNESARFIDRRLRPRAKQGDEKAAASFWTGLAIDSLLLLVLVPLFLVLAGLSPSRVGDLARQAFLGFRVGGVSISIAQILAALALFFGLLAATRLAQRGLARGPFAHTRLDEGVQNSLTTLLGYVGLAVAAIAGVTALGFDLSNLAIIAGALSVGVGFGLQSVVNNFVSGLILLFERPIKVGDWIVTTSGEGIVKKISVRSTEIETFDRSTIIVPNSELVSSTVTNWMHKNRLGRIIVPVGVAYRSDPEQVREILLACARDHPAVVRFPEPFVVFSDFGPSALQFELRAFLADITTGLQARTELRLAILKAFRAAGIEIPFPQSQVHIRAETEEPRRISAPVAAPAAEAPRAEPEEIDAGPDD